MRRVCVAKAKEHDATGLFPIKISVFLLEIMLKPEIHKGVIALPHQQRGTRYQQHDIEYGAYPAQLVLMRFRKPLPNALEQNGHRQAEQDGKAEPQPVAADIQQNRRS